MTITTHIDQHGFVRSAHDGKYGDSVWRSGWLYFACLSCRGRPSMVEWLKRHKIDPTASAAAFLSRFAEVCIKDDRLLVHPDQDQHFSRDQLVPMLMLLAVVSMRAEEIRPLGLPIIEAIVRLDEKYGAVAPVHQGEINDNLRYIIGKVAKVYGVKYKKATNCLPFVAAIAGYEKVWEYLTPFVKPKDRPRPYTIFNNAGLLSIIALFYGLDKDVQSWRKYFDWYAKHGWGVFYQILAGTRYTKVDIEEYEGVRHYTNDILSQRGEDHFDEVRPGHAEILDYPILLAMEEIWT